MKSFLIIQTAFIGDLILATSLIESIRVKFPEAKVDFVLRKGNDSLLDKNPHVRHLFVWNKKEKKYKNLFALIKEIRQNQYDVVINAQRFASTGFITWRSRAKHKVGFTSNPFSFSYSKKIIHKTDDGRHEIERNHELLSAVCDAVLNGPKLYPSSENWQELDILPAKENYFVLAPASVWFTKQLPDYKWVELTQKLDPSAHIYLIGAPDDKNFLDEIIAKSRNKNVLNLAGKLSLLASAALMQKAKRTYVNDSAPLHLASAMNAPVTAYFCSTVTSFGFTPLSSDSKVVEIQSALSCRPCGLHGYSACPKGHFDCGNKIMI